MRRESRLKAGPREAGGSNPSGRHGSTGQGHESATKKEERSSDASSADLIRTTTSRPSERASQREVVSGDRGHGAGRACCRQHKRREESKESSNQVHSNQIHSCLCREVPADHEAPSQAEAKRIDDSCEKERGRERCEHSRMCHNSKLWRDAHPECQTKSLRQWRREATVSLGLHGLRCTIADSRWHSHKRGPREGWT